MVKIDKRGRERGKVNEWGQPHSFDPGQSTQIIAWKRKKQTLAKSRYYLPLTSAILEVVTTLVDSLLEKVQPKTV